MRRFRATDIFLLLLLVPIWLLCLTYHVYEARSTLFAWPGIYVSSPISVDGYPVYVGHLSGTLEEVEIEPGDRLLAFGNEDLRGLGPIAVIARAVAQRQPDGVLVVQYQRDSHVRESRLLVPASPLPWWWYLPMAVGFALTGLIILLRGPDAELARTGFLAAMLWSLFYLRFYGGSVEQTYVWLGVYGVSATACFPLGLRTVLLFPGNVARRSRVAQWSPWLLAPLGPAIVSLSFGAPFPAPLASVLAGTLAIGMMAAFLAILTMQYRATDALGRRQIKWVVYGYYIISVPAFLCVGIALYDPNYWWASEAGQISGTLAPIFILFAVWRYHMLDIDGLISTTASYTVLSVAVVSGALTLAPRVAHAASEWFGVAESLSQVTLSVVLAAIAVPLHHRLRPQIEKRFFADRRALEEGVQKLLEDLSKCNEPGEIFDLAGERLYELLRPEGCAIFAGAGGVQVPVFVRGRNVPLALENQAPLITTLSALKRPLRRENSSKSGGLEELDPFARAALQTLDAAVLAPVLDEGGLLALLSLGDKRSHDIYTTSELALIGVVTDRVASTLRRFDAEELLRQQLEMYEKLRRYVPSRLAEQLESGQSLEPRDLEVTVLFVDLWGYTAFSEDNPPDRIFWAVNRYAETVSRVVRRLGGTMVEFAGDGVMVVFGAPEPLEGKERVAVQAAIELVDAVRRMAGPGDAPSRAGVGVATGKAIVGSIRSVDRTLWSAIGRTTNLASRLQQMTREFDAMVVIDSLTYERAGNERGSFVHQKNVTIRGRRSPVDLHFIPSRDSASRWMNEDHGEHFGAQNSLSGSLARIKAS